MSGFYIFGTTDDGQHTLPWYSGRLFLASSSDWLVLSKLAEIAEQSAFLKKDGIEFAVVLEQTFPRKMGNLNTMIKALNYCKGSGLEYWRAEKAFQEHLSLLQKTFYKFRIQLEEDWRILE